MVINEEKFSMLNFIKEVCDEIGPRLGTSEQELKAGLKIKKILEKKVDEIILEDFTCHPKGFLDFTRVAFISAIIGTGLFFWFPIISIFLYFYAISTFLFEQMFLKEYVDFLFPKAKGSNVIGKLKPSKESKLIIICSAHHDSAYEFPLFEKFKSKFGILAYITVGTMLLSAIAALIKLIFDLLGISSLISNIILILFPIVSVIMLGYLGLKLHSKNVILGANDNLSGVSVVLALAHYFSVQKLQNIELWFISFSCEECMRGSKRFVQRHHNELKNSKTINLDMVGEGEISIISAEPYFTTKHSLELAKEFQQANKKANVELPIKVLGFGGTDAAFFSKKKLEAISIVGLTPAAYPCTWHELADTPERINEELLQKAYKAIIQYLRNLDSKL
jgi:hypothetical protein